MAHFLGLAGLASLTALSAGAGDFTVNLAGDAGAGSGLAGDIRYCLNAANANPGSTITFIPTYSSVTLTSPLPPITAPTYIAGNFPTISGGGAFRIFFVDAPPGTQVTFVNLLLQNGRAKGGDGGAGGGGGGLGAGGAIFVNSGDVVVEGCGFSNFSAVGGNGGAGSGFTFVAGGGGGGLGGNGGNGVDLGSKSGGGGGGGWFGNGGSLMGGGGGRFGNGGNGYYNGFYAGGGGGGANASGGNAFPSGGNVAGGAGADSATGGPGLSSTAALTAGFGQLGGGGGGGSITSNDSPSALGTGGDGGKYGGGGAGGVAVGATDGVAGAGGDFGGGGGAVGRGAGQGGSGGFGGGGGGGPVAVNPVTGGFLPSSGRGGFGAGAGGASRTSALGPAGPFGGAGGLGNTSNVGVGGGGGGGALGAVIFVRDNNGATLEVRNSTLPAGTLTAGAGGASGGSSGSPGQPGSVLGTGLFIPRTGLSIVTGDAAVFFGGSIVDAGGAAAGAVSLSAVASTGVFVFAGANTYGGGTTVNSGTLRMSGAGTPGSSTAPLSVMNGGSFDLNGTSQSVGVCNVFPTGTLTNSSATPATLSVGNGGTSGTLSGFFSGNVSLVKAGNALTNVVAPCQYTGSTTVLGGQLRFGQLGSVYNGGTLPGSSIVLQNVCTLEFNRSDTFGNAVASPVTALVAQASLIHNIAPVFNKLADVVLTGVGAMGAELRSNGGFSSVFPGFHLAGTVTADGTATSIITATTAQNGFNAIQLGNNAPGGATTFVVQDVTGSPAVDLRISAPLADSRSAANPANPVPSGLVKAGPGTLLLNGDNTYTGGTAFNAGTVALGHANGLGPLGALSFGGGTLRYESGLSLDLSARFAPVAGGQFFRIDTNGQNVQFATPTSGAGGLVKTGAGTLTLTGAHTYTGLTTVSAGTLQLGDGVTSSGSIAGDVTDNAALVFGNVGPLSYGGAIGGTGTVTKSGPGTLTWNTRHDYAGVTTVSAGTLTLDPGAELAFSPTVTVASGATLLHRGIIRGAVQLNGTLIGNGSIQNGLTVGAGALATTDTGPWSILGNIVNQGTIRVTNGAVLQAAGATSFVNQGVLDLLAASPASTLPANFVNSPGGLVLLPGLVRVKTATRTLNPDNTTYTVTVTIDGYAGHTYTLQRSTSLAADTFVDLPGSQTGSGTAPPATLTFLDPAAPAFAGFYRVRLNP
ncbi:MAG: autotransporter-associated beta strand repeat-containing protein [Verrucomicrobia bacterium]|nr:autotransporter-associated beta strand repeat-containing protein [Verrucomicrobiota bacterium]